MAKLDAIGIVVGDLKEAVAFYGRLGCDFGEVAEGDPHLEARLGGVRLMLDDAASLEAMGHGGELAPRHGIALAAACESADEVDALHAEFAAQGLGKLDPFDAPWGQRYASIRDPWGTQVDLYAWLPGQGPQG